MHAVIRTKYKHTYKQPYAHMQACKHRRWLRENIQFLILSYTYWNLQYAHWSRTQ